MLATFQTNHEKLSPLRSLPFIGRWLSSKYLCIILILLLPLIILAPFLYGYWLDPKLFTGFLVQMSDQNIYFGFMNQALDGNLRFVNLPCHILHEREYINTLYLVIGLVSRWTGWPLDVTYFLSKYLFSVCFGISFLVLLKMLGAAIEEINAGILVCLWGGGFGAFGKLVAWINGYSDEQLSQLDLHYYPVDLWLHMINPWRATFYTPVYIWSYWLVLTTYLGLLLGEIKKKVIPFLVSSLSIGFLMLSHSYDAVPIFCLSIVIFILFRMEEKEKISKKVIYGYATFLGSYFMTFSYQFYVLHFNPGFSLWREQNVNLSPDPIRIFLGFGVMSLGFFEMLLRMKTLKSLSLLGKFLSFWLILQTLLLYSPIPFNRMLILGIFIPLSIFFIAFLCRLTAKGYQKTAVGLLLLCFVSPVAQNLYSFYKVHGKSPLYFYTPLELEAYSSLNGNRLCQEDVVLSSMEYSNRLLRFCRGSMIFAAAQQSAPKMKERVKKIFYGCEKNLQGFLKENRVSYIFLNKAEHEIFIDTYQNELSAMEIYFENAEYMIYRIPIIATDLNAIKQ